jgi:putative CocE/NonD family hydrolase
MARLLLALLTLLALLPAAASAAVPPGANWTQEYIETPDGEELHVDVLRPKGVPDGARVPVIAIVSPYLGHSVEGIPSDRFKDLFDGARVFERGYAVVMVDLRGSGGSSGCLDILGPGEQTDIRTAIEWAASRPWSNGRVGMYGKSYDGNTGVAGAALRPRGLHAVVAQQVVGDRYSGSYSGGVRYLQSLAYPRSRTAPTARPGWRAITTPTRRPTSGARATSSRRAAGPPCRSS